MAGVIAQTKGFTSIGELIIPLAFHALSMFFGMMFYAMGTQNKNMLVADK